MCAKFYLISFCFKKLEVTLIISFHKKKSCFLDFCSSERKKKYSYFIIFNLSIFKEKKTSLKS